MRIKVKICTLGHHALPTAMKWSIPINTLLDNSLYKVLEVSFSTISADQKYTALPSN